MTPWAWVALGIAMLGLLGSIVWLGAANDGDGDPLIENPGAVVVATLSLISGVLAILVPRLTRIDKAVNNHHDTNLRDDLTLVLTIVERVEKRVSGTARDVGRLTGRVNYIQQRVDGVIDAVDDLEKTLPTRKDSSS